MSERDDGLATQRLSKLRQAAYDVALGLGPDKGSPFFVRLQVLDPTVTIAEAEELEAWIRQVMIEARELAENVRRHSRRDEIPAETEAWRAGVEQLMHNHPGIQRDQANRLIGLGMVRTAM